MEVIARTKYSKLSAQKARRVARLIVGKDVMNASNILRFLPHKSATIIAKVLSAARANASHNYKLNDSGLVVQSVLIDEGPFTKRFMPRARGRVNQIKKRTSHITIKLKERT